MNAGCAAHICAAAKGGARFDPSQSPAERRSAANAIWLCRNCGEIVDDDETKYSPALLRTWKAAAEAEAERNVGRAPRDWQDAPPQPRPSLTWANGEISLEIPIASTQERRDHHDKVVDERRFSAEELDAFTIGERLKAVAYNQQLDESHAETKRARDRKLECDAIESGVLAKLKLRNDGRAALDNARCRIRFPKQLRAITDEDRPKRLPFPVLPRRPSIGPRSAAPLSLGEMVAQAMPRAWVDPLSLFESPAHAHHGGLYAKDGEFAGWVDSLTHNFQFEFEDGVWIVPPVIAGVYEVQVTVHAHNLPEPWRGTLIVRATESSTSARASS